MGATSGIGLGDGSPDRIAALKERYLLAPDVVYLNHASIGTVPRAVHDARARYLSLCEENPWLYMWGGAWEEAREGVRADLARLLGCAPGEVALTHNTTEGFNVLARGLELDPGDEVLFSNLNHDGASVCWEHESVERGYSVRRFELPLRDVGGWSVEDIVELHAREIRPETRVLCFPHVDNTVGLRHPVKELARVAHERGVEVVAVDGAQTAGMVPLELAESGVDAFAGSPHKWIQSPKGLGFLYLRPELQKRLRALWVTWGQERWAGTVRIFEDYGTRNLPEVLALGDAVTFQERLGEREKVRRYRQLRQRMRDRVDSSPELRWRSPEGWETGASLVAVERKGVPAGELAGALYRDHGAVVRAFGGGDLNHLRVSPNVATSEAELDRFFDLVEGYPG